MNKDDENWLLSSIAKAWNEVRVDAGKGLVWTERDSISSFYRHLMPLVEGRELAVHSEMRIEDSKGEQNERYIDLAITSTTSIVQMPEPSRIIVHFEFKFKWHYSRGYVRDELMDAIKKMNTGNEHWTMKVRKNRWSAKTDFVVLCLVADKWDEHTKDGGILHPNGTHGLPQLEDLREGLRYFELHGPFSTVNPLADWGFFEISRDGQKREIT